MFQCSTARLTYSINTQVQHKVFNLCVCVCVQQPLKPDVFGPKMSLLNRTYKYPQWVSSWLHQSIFAEKKHALKTHFYVCHTHLSLTRKVIACEFINEIWKRGSISYFTWEFLLKLLIWSKVVSNSLYEIWLWFSSTTQSFRDITFKTTTKSWAHLPLCQ